ncbi:hypothetical protein [Burkholderia sp. PR2]
MNRVELRLGQLDLTVVTGKLALEQNFELAVAATAVPITKTSFILTGARR